MIIVPKGTKDMLPAESYKWQKVEKAVHSIAALYNAKQIRTPVFESADLFLRSIGEETDVVNKEMYIFEDKGGRKMALRPEGTAGVMRSFIENNLGESLPLKTYYIESLYRYERPQSGRYREHHQFGAEFFGSAEPSFDVEILCMARDFLRSLGITDLTLKINSIGCPECRKRYNAALRKFLADNIQSLCADCVRRAELNPLRALDCKNPSCQSVYVNAPKISDYLCDDCNAHFKSVLNGLEANGIKYVRDDKLVRGLDYYTRTVFEFVTPELTVLGGGRYDGLCEQLGGKPMPCVGFGCGLERLIDYLDKTVGFKRNKPCVYVAAQYDGARETCSAIVRELRGAGISAECDLMGKSLKAQFKYADRQDFLFVITIGESEMQSGVLTVKKMSDGSTYSMEKRDLVEQIGRMICPK